MSHVRSKSAVSAYIIVCLFLILDSGCGSETTGQSSGNGEVVNGGVGDPCLPSGPIRLGTRRAIDPPLMGGGPTFETIGACLDDGTCNEGLVCEVNANTRGGICASAEYVLPPLVVVWADPQDLQLVESKIRDASNGEGSYLLIGSDGTVLLMPTLQWCSDCIANGGTFVVDGIQLIDVRFGIGPGGPGDRHPFLVDRASGEFVELLPATECPVEFRPSGIVFEQPNDSSDDLAIEIGTTDNPVLASEDG